MRISSILTIIDEGGEEIARSQLSVPATTSKILLEEILQAQLEVILAEFEETE